MLALSTDRQLQEARQSRDAFSAELVKNGYGIPTTEIIDAPPFYYAEEYHQQYLARNPNGYCGLGGTGVCYPAQEPTGSASN